METSAYGLADRRPPFVLGDLGIEDKSQRSLKCAFGPLAPRPLGSCSQWSRADPDDGSGLNVCLQGVRGLVGWM